MYPKVEVIAHYIPGESPKPLRIRFLNEEEKYIVYRIEKVLDVKMERLMGNLMLVYRLKVMEGNAEKIIGLKYERDTMLWYLTP